MYVSLKSVSETIPQIWFDMNIDNLPHVRYPSASFI